MEGLETVVIWLSCEEQEDKNILQLIYKCKQKMNVIIFLSGSKYTLKETIDNLIANHIRKDLVSTKSADEGRSLSRSYLESRK